MAPGQAILSTIPMNDEMAVATISIPETGKAYFAQPLEGSVAIPSGSNLLSGAPLVGCPDLGREVCPGQGGHVCLIQRFVPDSFRLIAACVGVYN